MKAKDNMKKTKEKITCWVCIVDNSNFIGQFDTEAEAITKAKHHNQNYLGYCRVLGMSEKKFRMFIRGLVNIISDKKLVRAYGYLDRRFTA
jgi:hypothetical protein